MFLTSFIFLIVLIFSTYGIGKKIKNKEVGFLAATICSFFHIIHRSSIEFNLALAAPAMTTLIIYLLLNCDGFRKRSYSFLLGMSFGLGFLTRELVLLFAFGPILYTIWRSFKNKNAEAGFLYRQRLINLMIFLFISCLIILLYSHNPITIKDIIRRMSFVEGEVSGGQSIFSWSHLSFYARVLYWQIGSLGIISFLVSFCVLLYSNEESKLLLLSWIAVPFFALTFVYLKSFEYSMSYLPAIALIISLAINRIKTEGWRKGIALSVIIIAMSEYFKNF